MPNEAAPAAPTTPAPNGEAKPNGAPAEAKPLVIGGISFRSENDAKAEIERGRQSNKLLTEAQRRLYESSKLQKDWEETVSTVKTKKDAAKAIEKLGLSKEEAVEIFGRWLYENEVLPREMSPEQRRIRELEAEKARFEEERRSKEEEFKARQHEEMTAKEAQKLRGELEKVLESKRVPGTRLALRRLANYMAAYADAGADIPADRAADLVAEDYKQEFGELFDDSTPDQLVEFFGKEKWLKLAQKVSAWAMARQKAPGQNTQHVEQVPASRQPSQKQSNDAKMTPQEFQRYIRGLK